MHFLLFLFFPHIIAFFLSYLSGFKLLEEQVSISNSSFYSTFPCLASSKVFCYYSLCRANEEIHKWINKYMIEWLYKIISLKYRFSFIRRIQAKFSITYSDMFGITYLDMFGITYSDIQERTHSFLEKSWIQWSLRQFPLQQFIYFLKIWSFESRNYLLNRFFLTAYLL